MNLNLGHYSFKKMNSEQEIHHFLNNYKESIQAMHLNEIITHGKSAAAEGISLQMGNAVSLLAYLTKSIKL